MAGRLEPLTLECRNGGNRRILDAGLRSAEGPVSTRSAVDRARSLVSASSFQAADRCSDPFRVQTLMAHLLP
jgi:hypothetical protein